MEGIVKNSGAGVCPICLKDLLDIKLFKARAKARSRSKGKKSKSKPPKPKYRNSKFAVDDEFLVLVTECGHLFHKDCLNDYAHNFKKVTGSTFSDCPKCKKRVAISRAMVVDLPTHIGFTESAEKEYRHGKFMNEELNDQLRDTQEKIEKVTNQMAEDHVAYIQYSSEYAEIKKVLDVRKSNYDRILALKSAMKESNDTILVLKRENRQLTSIFIYMAKEHSDTFAECGRKISLTIPAILLPHIEIIQETPDILEKFTQILYPTPTLMADTSKGFIQSPTRNEAIHAVLAAVYNHDGGKAMIRNCLHTKHSDINDFMLPPRNRIEGTESFSNFESANTVFETPKSFVRKIHSLDSICERREKPDESPSDEDIEDDIQQYSKNLHGLAVPGTALEEVKGTLDMVKAAERNEKSARKLRKLKKYLALKVKEEEEGRKVKEEDPENK